MKWLSLLMMNTCEERVFPCFPLCRPWPGPVSIIYVELIWARRVCYYLFLWVADWLAKDWCHWLCLCNNRRIQCWTRESYGSNFRWWCAGPLVYEFGCNPYNFSLAEWILLILSGYWVWIFLVSSTWLVLDRKGQISIRCPWVGARSPSWPELSGWYRMSVFFSPCLWAIRFRRLVAPCFSWRCCCGIYIRLYVCRCNPQDFATLHRRLLLC